VKAKRQKLAVGSFRKMRSVRFGASVCWVVLWLVGFGGYAWGQTRARGATEATKGKKGGAAAAQGKVTMPRLKKRVRAIYPPGALAKGLSGKVRLHLVIDTQGKVAEAKVVKGAGHGFDEAALEAVKKFEFHPATLDGKPVRVKIPVIYPFALKKQKTPEKSQDKPEGRPDGKPEGRPDGKPEGRPDGKPEGRPDGKPEGRPDGKPEGRPDGKSEGRPDGKPEGRRDGKPEGRPDGKPEGGPAAKKWRTLLRVAVVEKGTRNPIKDAVCLAERKDAAGDWKPAKTIYASTAGVCRFVELRPARYRVRVKSPNHKSYTGTERLTPGAQVKVRYYLERTSYAVYETVVTGQAQREEVSRHIVVLPEIQRIPGTQGDALRSVQNLPGVARAPFGAGLLVVRGSAPGDTSILLHGHPIPLLFHFGGLTSVINSDILKEINFIPGNFSVRHGKALGGIIDVTTRTAKKRWHGYVDIDIWDAGMLLEGPVGKGSFAISARRSYIDALLGLLPLEDAPISFKTAPVYYDYQAMLDYPLLGGNAKVFVFGSDDRLKFLFDEPSNLSPTASGGTVALMFHRLMALYNRRVGKFVLKGSVSTGWQRIGGQLTGGSLSLTLDLANVYWRAEATRKFGKKLALSVGIDGEFTKAYAKATLPAVGAADDMRPIGARETIETDMDAVAYSQALYVEGVWKPHKRVTLIPGLRLDYYKSMGFARYSFDPRLKGSVTVHKDVDLKAGVGLFHQPPGIFDLLEVLGGNPDVGYERGLHVSAGVQWRAPGGLEINSTGFYKYLTRLVTRTYDAVIEDGELKAENQANAGKGRIYGMELLIKKPLKGFCPKFMGVQRCFGWISYTLMRSERKLDSSLHTTPLPPGAPSGEYQLFEWDQTHLLTMVLTLMFKHNWEVGLRFRYATGRPTSPARGGIYDADSDTYMEVPGALNSERIPEFHQLDLRIDKKWVFKSWMLRVYLDIQNIYYRKNPEFLQYNFNYTRRQYISGLPIIPSLGIKGEF
jgi:TonB family protein